MVKSIINENDSSIFLQDIDAIYLCDEEKEQAKESFDLFLGSKNCILCEKEKIYAKKLNNLKSIAIHTFYIDKETLKNFNTTLGCFSFRYMYDISSLIKEFRKNLNKNTKTCLVVNNEAGYITYCIEFDSSLKDGYELIDELVEAIQRVEDKV